MRTTLILLTAALLAAASPSYSQMPAAETDAAFNTIRTENHIPGLSAAIAVDGEVIWTGESGLADLENNLPVSLESRFRLGSVSKVITATLAARLAEGGHLDLDAPISEYLPDLPAQHANTTLRQLLGHQGGVRHYGRSDFNPSAPGGLIDQRFYPDTSAALSLFVEDDLVAAPGSAYHYSTFGYTLATAVMEAATGANYLDLLEAWIAGPLGLDSLESDDPFALRSGRVRFYDPAMLYEQQLGLALAGPLVNALPANPAYKWAGGGLLASAADLARFGAAMSEPGFLSERMHSELMTPQFTALAEETPVGLGWNIDQDDAGRLRYHHAGLQQGTRSVLLVYPEYGVAIALMSNLGGMPQDILEEAAGLAVPWLG